MYMYTAPVMHILTGTNSTALSLYMMQTHIHLVFGAYKYVTLNQLCLHVLSIHQISSGCHLSMLSVTAQIKL